MTVDDYGYGKCSVRLDFSCAGQADICSKAAINMRVYFSGFVSTYPKRPQNKIADCFD